VLGAPLVHLRLAQGRGQFAVAMYREAFHRAARGGASVWGRSTNDEKELQGARAQLDKDWRSSLVTNRLPSRCWRKYDPADCACPTALIAKLPKPLKECGQ